MLPFLSDSEEQLEETIRTVNEYEADFIFVGGLTLFGKGPTEYKTLYYKFLAKHYLELVPKYIFLHHQKNIRRNLMKNQRNCVRNVESKITLFNGSFGAERFVALLLALTSFRSYNTGYTASLCYAQIGYRRLRIARFRYMKFKGDHFEKINK